MLIWGDKYSILSDLKYWTTTVDGLFIDLFSLENINWAPSKFQSVTFPSTADTQWTQKKRMSNQAACILQGIATNTKGI